MWGEAGCAHILGGRFQPIDAKTCRGTNLSRRLAADLGERAHYLLIHTEKFLPYPHHNLIVTNMTSRYIRDGDLHEHLRNICSVCLRTKTPNEPWSGVPVSYTHLRAHETP